MDSVSHLHCMDNVKIEGVTCLGEMQLDMILAYSYEGAQTDIHSTLRNLEHHI